MSRKNIIESFDLISSGDMSADITSSSTSVKNLDKASIRVTWDIGGTPSGTLTVEAKQQKKGSPDSTWFTVDMGSTITIDTSATEHQLIFNELPFTDIRLKYSRTSGTGTMNAVISAKTVGA